LADERAAAQARKRLRHAEEENSEEEEVSSTEPPKRSQSRRVLKAESRSRGVPKVAENGEGRKKKERGKGKQRDDGETPKRGRDMGKQKAVDKKDRKGKGKGEEEGEEEGEDYQRPSDHRVKREMADNNEWWTSEFIIFSSFSYNF